ncbi:MAG: putative Zn-dependent protease [Lentisphaeria bacterium]
MHTYTLIFKHVLGTKYIPWPWCAVSLLSLVVATSSAFAADIVLPDFGGANSTSISPKQEYELGQKWLRLYRAQVPTSSDPFLQTYTENLIRSLAAYSDLEDKRLDILVIENPTLNAFAVPGGVIGVNTGLFDYSDTEDQFSSVLAHELAHLSQRHYARRVEKQRDNTIPNMAALLASILIAATAGGDAGIAAISATQAAAIDAQLRFSRQMEQEADRIGMETMVRSGKNPRAMSEMFDLMLKASRFQRRPPEFLLTHPLTESRVTDSQLRAQQLPQKYYPKNLEFALVKVRARLTHESNMQLAIKQFTDEQKGHKYQKEVADYGLTLALTRAGRLEDAKTVLEPLVNNNPDNLYYVVAQAEIEAEQEHFDKALSILKKKLVTHPNNHALNVRTAEILMKASRYDECESLLVAHSARRPKDDYVWYLLAEVHGLAGHIYEVHLARAEYFILNGLFDKAIIQLKNALRLVEEDQQLQAVVNQRLKNVRQLKEESRLQ